MSEFINHHLDDEPHFVDAAKARVPVDGVIGRYFGINYQPEGRTMILAIDPGITGALALYDPDINFLLTRALPVQWRLVNKTKKTEIDIVALAEFIVPRMNRISEVVIEKPTAMPGAGATSQFNFGQTCGQLEGLLRGMGFPVKTVHPTTWKVALDVPSDKRRSRGRAQAFFPMHAALFATPDTEGQAEAAMLAYWRCHAPEPVKPKVAKTGKGKAPRNKKTRATIANTNPEAMLLAARKRQAAEKRPVGRPKKK